MEDKLNDLAWKTALEILDLLDAVYPGMWRNLPPPLCHSVRRILFQQCKLLVDEVLKEVK